MNTYTIKGINYLIYIISLVFYLSSCSIAEFSSFASFTYNTKTIKLTSHQTSPAPLDVLLVVDNSPSMLFQQTEISNKVPLILSSLSTVDFKLAITTANKEEACVQDLFITQQDYLKDKEGTSRLLQEAVASVQITDKFFSTKGLYRTLQALDLDPNNSCKKWRRDNSRLTVIIITDSSAGSSNELLGDLETEVKKTIELTHYNNKKVNFLAPKEDPQVFANRFLDILNTQGKGSKVYGILGVNIAISETCIGEFYKSFEGKHSIDEISWWCMSQGISNNTSDLNIEIGERLYDAYTKVVQTSGGLIQDVLSSDYTSIFSGISKDMQIYSKTLNDRKYKIADNTLGIVKVTLGRLDKDNCSNNIELKTEQFKLTNKSNIEITDEKVALDNFECMTVKYTVPAK